MRIGSPFAMMTIAALLTAGSANAGNRLFFVEQPVRSHPTGSLAAHLSCAGVLMTITQLFDQGAAQFATGRARDRFNQMTNEMQEAAIAAFFTETGFSQQQAQKNRLAYSVLARGVMEQVRLFSRAYQPMVLPKLKLLPGPDADPAETQADVDHCIQMHEALT